MPFAEQLRIQREFRKYADISDWHSPHAVTLTMKQGVRDPCEPAAAIERLTADKAVQNFRHFMNLLNRNALGKRFQRHGMRLPVIPVLEGTQTKRMHYHAIIDCPRDDLKDRFPFMIEDAWSKTKFGYRQVHIRPDCGRIWTKYISKMNDKPSIADAIDWENLHRPIDGYKPLRDPLPQMLAA